MRIFFGFLAALLSGLIVWATLSGGFLDTLHLLLERPWGVVTLVDLYVGFIATSLLMLVFEGRTMRAAVLILLLFLMGNVVTALWVAFRLAPYLQRLQPSTRR
jgi:Protein of unknown function (DUF1475)